MLRSSPGVALHGAQGGEGTKACLCMTVVACSLYVREEMCVCVCVCLTSRHPIPDHRVGSAHCHHEGAARVALHVHKALLVYAEEEQRRRC